MVLRGSKLFAFGTAPVLILLVGLYAGIFTTVFVNDELTNVPKNQRGLNLDRAFLDLHQIAARPRPYNSHANDAVRAYILSRVRNITRGHDHVHVSNDLTSNVTFANKNYGVYFEGTNILVKVDGTDAQYHDKGGVLFSAHYDSVSTAKGVTDNAMSVVACLQMIEYLVEKRPKRTAVFNINNGEEDGLHGAIVFLRHPWFGAIDTFMNLEGAAAGGRPVIFRTTSAAPLRAFHPPNVPHPHANVLSSDGFSRGLIKSGTDFSVYAKGLGTSHGKNGPKQGVDIAFYKHRSFYHTKYDAIPTTDGGKRALWAMMEITRGGGWALLNEDEKGSSGTGDGGVYFDLFNKSLVSFTQRALLIFDIVILVLGPIAILGLVFARAIIAERRHNQHHSHAVNGDNHHPEAVNGAPAEKSIWQWISLALWGHGNGSWTRSKFWLSVVLSILLQVGFVWLYTRVNPYIVYSHPFAVFASTLILAYLSMTLLLKLTIPNKAQVLAHPHAVVERKQMILTQLYILTYILLLPATFLLAGINGTTGVGGLYFISALHLCVWSACLVGCIAEVLHAGTEDHKADDDETEEEINGGDDHEDEVERRLVTGVRFEPPEHEGDATGVAADGTRQGVIIETEPTEITPLVPSSSSSSNGGPSNGRKKGAWRFFPWSLIQVLLVVPIPVTLMVHVVALLMNGMAESLADGSSATIVYAAASLFSVLIVLPLVPFNSHIHNHQRKPWLFTPFTMLALLAFGLLTFYTMWKLPFSKDVPVKVSFQQTVEVDLSPPPVLPDPIPPSPSDPDPRHPNKSRPSFDNLEAYGGYSPSPLKVNSMLRGLQPYTHKLVLQRFPSAWKNGLTCLGSIYLGLEKCTWDVTNNTGMLPSTIARDDPTHIVGTRDWLRVKTHRQSTRKALIAVRGVNSRACRVYSDNKVIRRFRVWPEYTTFPPVLPPGSPSEGGSWDMAPGYEVPPEGVKEVRMWSRKWDREFVVELDWDAVVGIPANGTRPGVPSFHAQHPEGNRDEKDGEDGAEEQFKGRIACEWAEYESGTIGEIGGVSRGARIPAYEEVLDYLPPWAVATKANDGLVEVWGRVTI